jgi:hypothetical protein
LTRRDDSGGLSFPAVSVWPNFVCEACTVRSVTQRELTLDTDIALLCLERMRILDVVSYWNKGSHKGYQSSLRMLQQFGERFDVPILQPRYLERPASTADIVYQWAQEAHSLRLSSKRKEAGVPLPVSYQTVRKLRSAASQFEALDLMIADPTSVFLDSQRRVIQQPCRPTDGLGYTYHAKGLGACLGTASHPSIALDDRHIRVMLQDLDTQYRNARNNKQRRNLSLAGFAITLFWLGWLRSSEGFSTAWDDFEVTEPVDGPTKGLPRGVGVIGCRLRPETNIT